MQVDDEDSPARDASQLSQDRYHLIVFEMMREQRTHRIVKCTIGEWQPQGVTTKRGNFRKALAILR